MREYAWVSYGGRSADLPSDDLGGLRVDEADPRELNIHSAIATPDNDGELPTYVERDFDFKLRAELTPKNSGRGSFVVLVGGSSTGKTRSLYEAVYELVPDWTLVRPADAAELLDLKNAPPRGTVFWLDELQRYLGGHPALTSECVWALVRHGNLVVGTLWPDQYAKWTAPDEGVPRLVQTAVTISVPDALTAEERKKAVVVARRDDRIRSALDDAPHVGLTQTLAGAPQLVMCWDQPPSPYAKAIMSAAADAHRLGVQSPLSEDLLGAAMFGYLSPDRRVSEQREWLADALPHVTRSLHGNVSALSPADDGRPGTRAGYLIADYLAQHLRRVLRTVEVPREAWEAFAAELRRPEDLRRLAQAAVARLRYCHAEPALARLADEFGDGRAATELADLLIRQDRLEQAADVLRRQLASDPRNLLVGKKFDHLMKLGDRVAELRPPPGTRSRGIPVPVADYLADLGVCDELRRSADAGDTTAAERLVQRLAEHGRIHEIRARADEGDSFAAETLADLYAAWGDEDHLLDRVRAGDEAAGRRLSKMRRSESRGDGVRQQIAALRADVDEGRGEAALQLCTLLFELRDDDELMNELNAGTPGAAAWLIALRTAQEHPSLIELRAFGLDARGRLISRPPT